MTLDKNLFDRAGGVCELCGSAQDLVQHTLKEEHAVLVCGACNAAKETPGADETHWRCLETSIWSEHAPVQVISYRLLRDLGTAWATDLLDQVYLDEETLEWAKEDKLAVANEVVTLDSNGARLQSGDSVTLIKDLNVKGTSFTAKRGTTVRNIRVGDDPEYIEGRVNKVSIMLKTCFLKKVS